MFDPRDPYERFYWHYESRRPLSIAQIIALQSVDVDTVALIWLLLEHGTSYTVAGPTDPTPGVGKTTTLNALLQFLPEDTALAYMSGMYEDFSFTRLPDIDPKATYALCNEVSDHLPIYMWGRVARRYLRLPAQGYHIATSVHADTIDDVLSMFQQDLHLTPADIQRLGLVINIGLVGGRAYQIRRRWFTTYFFHPGNDDQTSKKVEPILLSRWNKDSDTFERANDVTLDQLASWIGLSSNAFHEALEQRRMCLEEITQGSGMGVKEMALAIRNLRNANK